MEGFGGGRRGVGWGRGRRTWSAGDEVPGGCFPGVGAGRVLPDSEEVAERTEDRNHGHEVEVGWSLRFD